MYKRQAQETPSNSETVVTAPVVVTATRTEKKLNEAPSSLVVITDGQLEQDNPKTLGDALLDIPNVMTVSYTHLDVYKRQLVLGFYLYLREAKSIKEHRNKVPHVFSGLVSLDAHKAASDARLHADKVNEIRHLSNLVLVLLLTFGGGITWFSTLLTNQLGNGLFTQILFALGVALAFLVINALFLAVAKNPEKNSSYSVSYTHLDVYKRQGQLHTHEKRTDGYIVGA